jgi:hypothetical protein
LNYLPVIRIQAQLAYAESALSLFSIGVYDIFVWRESSNFTELVVADPRVIGGSLKWHG